MNLIHRAAYICHAESYNFKRKFASSVDLIESHRGYAASTSWGKDSVVMLHMAAQVVPDLSVINARYPNPAERFLDMDRVRDLVLMRDDMRSVIYREVDTPGEWEMYERAGGGFAEAQTQKQREATRWWKKNFLENMASALAELECTGSFLGIRSDESHARRMNVIIRGDSYMRADGAFICLPIASWSAKDIWAYLVTHDLPWLNIYDHAHCGRERARSGFVFATGGAGAIRRHGVWEDWRRVYPSQFNAWMQRFPELDK